MKHSIPALLSAVLLLSAPFAANAATLVYEGFAKSDYNIGEAAGSQGTASSYPGANVSAIGTSSAKWAGMGGSQIKVYGSYYGLSLPATLVNDGFTSTGGSIGLNNGSNSSDLRGMYHSLATDVLKVSDGKLYIRMLLCIDAKAAGKLAAKSAPANASGGYYGFGVMKAPGGNNYSLLCQSSSPSAIGFGIWKDSSNNYNISLMLTSATGVSSNYEVFHGIAMDTTYICYAEVSVGTGANGAETVRAGAQNTAEYQAPVVWAAIGGDSDSVDVDLITDTVYPNAMGVCGPYGSNGGFFRADELRIGTQISDVLVDAAAGAPQLDVAAVSGANGVYAVGDTVLKADATDAGALAVDSDGTYVKFSVGAVAENSPFSASIDLSRLSAGTTYQLYSYAENDVAAATNKAGIIYNGNLSIAKVKDANEYQCEAGEITVSRASADDFDLVVPYVISAKVDGKGTEGATWEVPAAVTIPAGETSATLVVKPKVDASIDEDIEVVVSAGPGRYTGFSPATLDVAIANVAFPAGYNVWKATAAGLASDPDNWSAGHSPLASEAVLFDGNFSSADCEWDAAASATVASWTQRYGYAGTVTLDTVFPGKGDFTCLTVTGAMTIDAGSITHPQSVAKGDAISDPAEAVADLIANETYRIRIAAGSLAVGASGKIDAMGKGYYMDNTGSNTMPVPSHGGVMSPSGCRVYGDPKEPIHVGLPYKTASGTYFVGKGGGAVYLTVSGAVTVDGVIRADSSDGSWASNARASGAAGSVYIRAASVSGTGSITADGSNSLEQNNKGVGGRVAIITETPVDRGTFAAISAKVHSLNNSSNQATTFGGAGTVYFMDSTMTYGKLVVAEKTDHKVMTIDRRCTYVGTEGDWTFDSVEIGRNSYLFVPVGTALNLPAGLVSVTGTATDANIGGIVYEGGALDIGDYATQTVVGNWIFTGWSNFVFHADVTVTDGAAIGVPRVSSVSDNSATLPAFLSSSVTVDGDLTVTSTGLLPAFACGFRKPNQWVEQGLLGHSAHGGRIMAAQSQPISTKGAYDSVFAPSLPGCSIPWPNGQAAGECGGAMKLVVSGALTLDGAANASGSPEAFNQGGNASGGAGGSIDITAGTLSGSGRITADGGAYGWHSGPGGRIAVKLTDAGADFSDFTGLIRATGRSRGSHEGAQGSAGTIYLKTGSEDDFGGTLTIACPAYDANENWNNKTSTTEVVSMGFGGDAIAAMKQVALVVSDNARAAVNTNVEFRSVAVLDATSSIDFEGHTLTTRNAVVGTARISAGEYTIPARGFLAAFPALYNSSDEDGTLVVLPSGTIIIMR